jgi:uncharacterized SAM-binding protein YcdF (DUF218 family)
MYFVLSKVLLFLIYPFLWVFALLVMALMAKTPRRKKRFFIAAVLVLYIFSAPLFLNVLAGAWSVDAPTGKDLRVYSCAIVLGGFAGSDKNGNGYFNGSADRFIQGLKVLKTGRAKHILVTGGNGNLFPGAFSEGKWVKSQLDELKVPDSSVLIEGNSRNTIENADFSRPILQKAGLEPPYLLITSDFHMRRAYMIFRNRDYDVVPYPCNYMAGFNGFNLVDLIPDAGTLAGWNIYLKEMVGYVVDSYK